MHLKLVSAETGASPTGEASALERVISIVSSWDGVQVGRHRFGGVELTYRGGELGHVCNEGILDLPFPQQMRDRLVAEGMADLHHILPMSGWVSFRIEDRADVAHAVRLLRIAYRRRRLQIASLKVH
jgi:hypothetical protein